MKNSKMNIKKAIIRISLLLLLDVISIILTYVGMYILLDDVGVTYSMNTMYVGIFIVILIKIVVNTVFGLYKGLLKYTGFEDGFQIFLALITKKLKMGLKISEY